MSFKNKIFKVIYFWDYFSWTIFVSVKRLTVYQVIKICHYAIVNKENFIITTFFLIWKEA